jgi:IS5 family transposase
MGPKQKVPQTNDLFKQPLVDLVNLNHPLVKLADLIDWSVFETEWSGFFPSTTGRPAIPSRMIAGLLYLQHTFSFSDQELVWTWVENPYWRVPRTQVSMPVELC